MQTQQEHIEYVELTSETNVKFRFKINKARGNMEVEVGVIPPDRDKHIIAMSTTETICNKEGEIDDNIIAATIGAVIREWDDVSGDDLLTEDDAGQDYVDWED